MGICRYRKNNLDNFLFADQLEFDKNLPKKFILSIFTYEKKDINSIKSGKGGNNVELEASKENLIIDSNNSDSKPVLILVIFSFC